jgi:predicted TIM-barrel fold metal-dependent hydrolase
MEAHPRARVVINHVGGKIGVGPYAEAKEDVFRAWSADLARLAKFANVHVKLGGLGMNLCGFHFYDRPKPPTSDELQAAWQPTFEAVIDLFGPERCMLESNFPVDKASCSYGVMWNAFKKITCRYPTAQRSQLFFDTAKRFYNIEP